MSHLDLPIRAATETALAHGVTLDRCEVLQDGNTLVLRLSETLVARVVQDVDGPRQGTEWFARETALARHLTQQGAPVVPMHPDLPQEPHEHLGYTLNFWLYVSTIEAAPEPKEIGATLQHCHEVLRHFPEPLPKLAILTESLALLATLKERALFPDATLSLLRDCLTISTEKLAAFPHQPLHGDAHLGNLMNTTTGLLWADWEDTFSGPVEWDLASILWNAKILEEDHDTVDQILTAYRDAGGAVREEALHHSFIARAAVMSAWYPILYPNPNAERQAKLQRRLDWLAALSG
ncbi:phosphotransferase [Prosthecobacter dejongeii]|uniref:Thiamine kinase-like enzyme n=1 Tax=Prosthecobacter dejongeii TaxID=48465 RepID=A0A7W8DNS9_9BACT|nr:aminoglycoside phosphotransferase family protein [Prosthecobacter dejongeii]MBB5036617.1 thiamine kinase-like enzyme [Prosthecobacter dejongeii]